MKIRIQGGLPFVTVTVSYRGRAITLENVVLDTGSAGSVFQTDRMTEIDIFPELDDDIIQIQGIGGVEFVYTRQIEGITVGALQITDFVIEIGAMAYGFVFDGILGFDFLQQAQAIIDLSTLELRPAP
jgi:hypothetical protein